MTFLAPLFFVPGSGFKGLAQWLMLPLFGPIVGMWSPFKKPTVYQYDEAGNLTKQTRGSAVCEYGFDYRNRMTSFDGQRRGAPSGQTGQSNLRPISRHL